MLSQLTRYASEFDVHIGKAELDVRATYDQRGKIMLEDVSPAAQVVTYRWEIESTSLPQRIAEVLRWIERGCHTINTLKQPVPVRGAATLNGAALEFMLPG
jgi:hypothetical protein